jgi:hypothetical protein
MRMARKPSGVARELLRNFPRGGKRRRKKRKRKGDPEGSKAKVDLAGAKGDAVAAGSEDEQETPVVDAVGDA